MATKLGALRRKHGAELKTEAVEECARPGASVAAISQARGLNANLFHQWCRDALTQSQNAQGNGLDSSR